MRLRREKIEPITECYLLLFLHILKCAPLASLLDRGKECKSKSRALSKVTPNETHRAIAIAFAYRHSTIVRIRGTRISVRRPSRMRGQGVTLSNMTLCCREGKPGYGSPSTKEIAWNFRDFPQRYR